MDKEVAATSPYVLVIPYPAQGHINPALAFAKCLASKGLLVTVITTTSVSKSANFSRCSSITIANISDGSEQVKETETIEGYFKRLKAVLGNNLAEFIDERKSVGCPAKAIIYDSIMPWILEIALEKGLLGASFFTQSLAVSAVFYHLKQGSLRFPYEDSMISLPSLPMLEKKDLPSFGHVVDPDQIVVQLLADQFSNLEKVDWIFFNTFDKLESEIMNWMASRWPIKTVGPTFLLLQKDEEFSENKNHTINWFEPKHDACRDWLASRETGSVVYVSFGSIASLGKEQMEELAFGLIMSDCYFLWVVRSSEVEKLPHDFTSLASKKGLIVEWCHQPEVLAHRALACFMSHCGWNSTLEALSHGVPLITMAQWVDQNMNSKFIQDVWRFGIGIKPGENGIIGREEIATCIKQVVHGDKGTELKKNACKWMKLASKAVGKDGTSAHNIENFVSKLICR